MITINDDEVEILQASLSFYKEGLRSTLRGFSGVSGPGEDDEEIKKCNDHYDRCGTMLMKLKK